MSAQHTPGPWQFWLPYPIRNGMEYEVRTRVHIACVTGTTNGLLPDLPSDVEAEANARLISAAPELLEALQLLIREVDESAVAGATDYGWKVATDKTRAAISKATGETT